MTDELNDPVSKPEVYAPPKEGGRSRNPVIIVLVILGGIGAIVLATMFFTIAGLTILGNELNNKFDEVAKEIESVQPDEQ